MILSHEPAILGACVAIVVVAAVTDFFTRKIPNILTFGGLAFGLVAHGAMGFVDGGGRGALRGLLLAFSGAILCGLLPFISFVRKQMGGGDVKLFAAIGAMAGPSLGLDTQLVTFLFSLFVMYPWAAVRTGAFRMKFEHLRSKLRGESVAPFEAVKLPRVALGPVILLGLCVAMFRQGILSWS
jgi:prepilin peptidase CpaA